MSRITHEPWILTKEKLYQRRGGSSGFYIGTQKWACQMYRETAKGCGFPIQTLSLIKNFLFRSYFLSIVSLTCHPTYTKFSFNIHFYIILNEIYFAELMQQGYPSLETVSKFKIRLETCTIKVRFSMFTEYRGSKLTRSETGFNPWFLSLMCSTYGRRS